MPTTYAIPNGRTVFDATAYSGDATSPRAITNQYGFKPDFVWVKNRSYDPTHTLYDSVRGVGSNKELSSPLTYPEGSLGAYGTTAQYGYVSALNSNGYSATFGSSGGSYVNASNSNYVAWQWQAGQGSNTTNTTGSITSTVSANVTAGFSIVTYTGNEVQGATVGHGLGSVPSFILIKDRTSAQNWMAWQTTLGASNFLQLNTTAASSSSAPLFNGVAPTSSVITLAGGSQSDRYTVNKSGDAYVAYCWAPVAGFSAFGSYTGNGSSDGPFVYTGFRPSFWMVKRTDTSSTWFMMDSSRNLYNVEDRPLIPNATDAEFTYITLDFLSNGFKIRNTGADINANGGTYIYMAFAENPFKFSNAR